jgi:flagellar biosynthesis/type III secretory pathway M-ring protein FliF/YscJ
MSVLTLSQRLAIGLCAALVVVSLLWLLQWSTEPELVPLVNYEFSLDEQQAAEAAVRGAGVPYRIAGGRILVRAQDRHNLTRVLHAAGALPEGSLYDMSSVVADDNPFQSPEQRQFAQTYAKGNELAKVIATSPFVKKAAVLINDKRVRRLGGQGDVPTASVNVTLTPGTDMTPEKVDGFAKLVAGAVAGLKPFNVYVTDSRTMRSYNVPRPGDPAGVDYLAIVKKREAHLQAKIVDKLAYIPGLRASVTVELDTSKSVKQKQTYLKPEPKTESTQTSEQTSPQQSTEPGVQANLGQALTAGAAGTASTSEETQVENYPPNLSETETIEKVAFGTSRVTATVGIPRSFVVSVFRARYPDVAEDPKDDDPSYVTVRDEQVARVKTSIERIVMAKSPEDVEVDIYPDMRWTAEGGGFATTPGGVAVALADAESFDAVGLLRSYGPQAILAMLAVMSLTMMMRVVRKSSQAAGRRAPRGEGADVPPEEEQMLTVGPHAVGQAAASEGFLVGKELDEGTLRDQELKVEVAKMVQDDPEGAADLIRRWIEESS